MLTKHTFAFILVAVWGDSLKEDKVIVSIMGPSGSGKTTLTDNLILNHDIIVPRHVTTREARGDDKPGFYRYIEYLEFLKLVNNQQFLIASSDGIRGYGVLKNDCFNAFENADTLLINSSYKDILQLKHLEIPVRLVVLTFQDIEKGIRERIVNSSRNHNASDIRYRVESALEDHEKYFNEVSQFSLATIYTDVSNKEETYRVAEEAIGFEPNVRKRVK